jgi:hypothetical protein
MTVLGRRMSLVTSAATGAESGPANLPQLLVLRRRVDDERRVKLLQHVAVLLEEQAEELPHVMAHDVHLQPFDDTRVLDRFLADLQADDLFERQHMGAAQVQVRVRPRKSVKVRAANRGEQQRIRLHRDDALKAGVNGHVLRILSPLDSQKLLAI